MWPSLDPDTWVTHIPITIFVEQTTAFSLPLLRTFGARKTNRGGLPCISVSSRKLSKSRSWSLIEMKPTAHAYGSALRMSDPPDGTGLKPASTLVCKIWNFAFCHREWSNWTCLILLPSVLDIRSSTPRTWLQLKPWAYTGRRHEYTIEVLECIQNAATFTRICISGTEYQDYIITKIFFSKLIISSRPLKLDSNIAT